MTNTLSHVVEIYVEHGELGNCELTFPARVTLTGYGRNAEFEIEWLDGEPADEELERAESDARDKFLDWAMSQPTAVDRLEAAADYAYDEAREWQIFHGGET